MANDDGMTFDAFMASRYPPGTEVTPQMTEAYLHFMLRDELKQELHGESDGTR